MVNKQYPPCEECEVTRMPSHPKVIEVSLAAKKSLKLKVRGKKLLCPKHYQAVFRFGQKKKRVRKDNGGGEKRLAVAVKRLCTDDPVLNAFVKELESERRRLRSGQPMHFYTIPGKSEFKVMVDAILSGEVAVLAGSFLTWGACIHILHKECMELWKAEPGWIATNLFEVCLNTQKPELRALLQGVANVVAGACQRQRCYNVQSIHQFLEVNLRVHNKHSNRYLVKVGAELLLRSTAEAVVNVLNARGFCESADTARRALKKAVAKRAETNAVAIKKMPANVNGVMDDFTSVATSYRTTDSAIHRPALTTSCAIFPRKVVGETVAMVNEHPMLPYDELASAEEVLRAMLHNGDYLKRRKSYLPEGKCTFQRLQGACAIEDMILVDQLTQSIKNDQQVWEALVQTAVMVADNRPEGECMVISGDWPVETRVICLLAHVHRQFKDPKERAKLTDEGLHVLHALERIVPMFAQFHCGKSARKAACTTFYDDLLRPLFAALHDGAELPSAVRDDDLNRFLLSLIIHAWHECGDDLEAELEANAGDSIEAVYFKYMILVAHLAVDIDDAARANNAKAWEDILAEAEQVFGPMGKTHYQIAIAATLSHLAYWKRTNESIYNMILESLCTFNEIKIEYYHRRLSEILKKLLGAYMSAEVVQQKAREFDALRELLGANRTFKGKENRMQRKTLVERKGAVKQVSLTCDFLRAMVMHIVEKHTSIEKAVRIGDDRKFHYESAAFSTIYANQLPLGFAHPSFSVACERIGCAGDAAHLCGEIAFVSCGHAVDLCVDTCAVLRDSLTGLTARDPRMLLNKHSCGRDECIDKVDGECSVVLQPRCEAPCCVAPDARLVRLSKQCPHFAHAECIAGDSSDACFVCCKLKKDLAEQSAKSAHAILSRTPKLTSFLPTKEGDDAGGEEEEDEEDEDVDELGADDEDENLDSLLEDAMRGDNKELTASAAAYRALRTPQTKIGASLKSRALKSVDDNTKETRKANMRKSVVPRAAVVQSLKSPTAKQAERAENADVRDAVKVQKTDKKKLRTAKQDYESALDKQEMKELSRRRREIAREAKVGVFCDGDCAHPEEDSNETVQCLLCQAWIHFKCARVEPEDVAGDVAWLCKWCKKFMQKARK